MARARLSRLGAVAAIAAVGGLALPGCDVGGQFGASCTTSPPVPHQDFGTVYASAEVPLFAKPGASFDIVVTSLGAAPGPPPVSPTGANSGTIRVTGPVTPSGDFGVSEPYPDTLTFQATGAPGEVIHVAVTRGAGIVGSFPNGFGITCNGGGEIGTTTIQD
jgi:hypothetical protein